MNLPSNPSPAAPQGPITPGERHRLVDALRGFALLGILIVNVEFIFQDLEVGWSGYDGPVDVAVRWLDAALVQQKFYLLFALLFGYGLSLQLARARAGGTPLGGRYARRMIGLLALGLLHAILFFVGDILVLYAMVGTVAYLLRRRSSRALLTIAGWLYGLMALSWLVLAALVALDDGGLEAEAGGDVYATGSFLEVAAVRAGDWLELFPALVVVQGPSALAAALAGVVLGRGDLLARPDRHRVLARRVLVRTAPLGLLGGALAATFLVAGERDDAAGVIGFGLQFAFAPLLTVAYVAGLALLIGAAPRGPAALLESGGRMSLSVYLLESVVAATLAAGYGAALYGDVGPAAGLALSVAIWGALMVASHAWLRVARFGPFEWLLRSFTYGRAQPLRRSG
jgi:uncharacterized protein